MPIIDYQKNAAIEEQKILSNTKISKKNKDTLKEFLLTYHVSPARKALFLKHIKFLLEQSQDVKIDMNRPKIIEPLFNTLREKLSNSYYATVVNCSYKLVRTLNDDTDPKGFKNIKRVSKKKTKRELSPNDMITWQEGEKLASMTKSLQMKAIILTQLDAGMRPSEFIDLKYGDVQIKEDIVMFTNKAKKNDDIKPVTCIRCVPIFLQWYSTHPLAKPDSPLWVMESVKIQKKNDKEMRDPHTPYRYQAVRARIAKLAKDAQINKPMDFYNFRHSSIALDKRDGLDTRLIANRHRTSIEHIDRTYGFLDDDEIADQYRQHYGKQTKKKEPGVKSVSCLRCQHQNELDASYCFKCAFPLDKNAAIKMEDERQQMINKHEALKEHVLSLENNFNQLMKQLKNGQQ